MADKKLILLVEDDPFLVEMYTKKFDDYGFDIAVASNGKKALEEAAARTPDIILLDVVMPEMDGFEALKKLKEKPETKDIPVIMLTNLGQKEEVERALELGATDYFIKAHFTPTEVANKVRDALGV